MSEPLDRPEPSERSVNHLRDARLHQALAHAPDQSIAPPAARRDAIKKAAAYAVSARPEATIRSNNATIPWWRRLWEIAGRPRGQSGPWNAAFATILVGSIITLIWYERDVPEATLADKEITMATNQATQAPQKPLAPQAPQAPTTEPQVAAVKPLEADISPAERRDLAKSKSRAVAAAGAVAVPVPVPPNHPVGAASPVVSAAPEAQAVSGPVSPVPAQTEKSEQAAPALADTARASVDFGAAEQKKAAISSSGSGALSAPAAAPAPAQSRVRGQARASPLASVSEWSSVQLSYQGRVVRLTRPQAQALVDQVMAQVAARTGASIEEPEGVPTLRLQLFDGNGSVAEFDLWRAAFKWRPKDGAEVSGILSAEQAAALVQEGARLVPP